MFASIPALIAAIKAAAPALVSAAPVAGVAAAGVLAVATHDPRGDLLRSFKEQPENVAACMVRNADSMKPLVLQAQPLYGTGTMGLTLKRGVTGDTLLVAVLTMTKTGSDVEFRPLLPIEEQRDVLEKLVAGCS